MAGDLSGILETAVPTLLTGNLGVTEGPVWHPGGYLTFVDIQKSRLLRWDHTGDVTVVRENTGEGNGCTLDRQGLLIMCEGADRRRISRMEANASISSLAERWQGKKLNRPNDVVCRSDGSIFFTDPEMRVPRELREIGFSGVYRIAPDGRLHLATDECEYPNGLVFSPDESVLYVAISRLDERCLQEEERQELCTHRSIRAFDVATDGALSHHRIFVDMSSAEPGVPDGLKVDTEGRVFCTGSGGIWVIDSAGKRLGVIRVPEISRNLAFGGSEFRSLYITAGSSLYCMKVKTPGLGA